MHNQEGNKVSVLFSGGKDSSLVAFILSKIFEVELITASFGILPNWEQAQRVARELKLPFKILKLDKKIIEEAAQMVIKDGYPSNGIKYIHQKVLEEVAGDSKIIADGVRRNDRVPVLSLSEITSFEDKFKVHYIQPLKGFSRKTLDILVKKYFVFKEYKGESFPGAEYEFELREFIKRKYGPPKVEEIFPKNHTHSVVIKKIKPS
jgi:hypothetical protein